MSFLTTIATAVRGGYHQSRAEHNRRIAAAFDQRKRSGRWIGRVPLGYRRPLIELADGRRVFGDQLEPDPETAPIARRIFAEALAGQTCNTIADGLNRDHFATGLGGVWTRRAVSKVLNNGTYLGRWGAPPLVDPATVALLTWPRPRRPLDPPTAWARRLAGLTPERRAEIRAAARECSRRYRLDHRSREARGGATASHPRTPAHGRGCPDPDYAPVCPDARSSTEGDPKWPLKPSTERREP